MDNNIAALVSGMGELTKLWTVIYSSFIDQGMKPKDALVHTKALYSTLVSSIMGGLA